MTINPVSFWCVASMAVFFMVVAGYWRERALRAEARAKGAEAVYTAIIAGLQGEEEADDD